MRVTSVLVALPCLCASVAFDKSRSHHGDYYSKKSTMFGVRGGGGEAAAPVGQNTLQHETRAAAATILTAIGKVERSLLHAVEHAVETEVDTLFHQQQQSGDDHEQRHSDSTKAHVAVKAKEVVSTGAAKVKKTVDQHAQDGTLLTHYPYAWPHPGPEHEAEMRILRGVEAAERALLRAVEEEVDTLFHKDGQNRQQQESESNKVAKVAVKKGVEKATEKVDKTHQHRRAWLADERSSIEAYLSMDFE